MRVTATPTVWARARATRSAAEVRVAPGPGVRRRRACYDLLSRFAPGTHLGFGGRVRDLQGRLAGKDRGDAVVQLVSESPAHDRALWRAVSSLVAVK